MTPHPILLCALNGQPASALHCAPGIRTMRVFLHGAALHKATAACLLVTCHFRDEPVAQVLFSLS